MRPLMRDNAKNRHRGARARGGKSDHLEMYTILYCVPEVYSVLCIPGSVQYTAVRSGGSTCSEIPNENVLVAVHRTPNSAQYGMSRVIR
jgi:hypothetical protein